MQKSENPIKIFISSRSDREYLKAFADQVIITVDASNQQEDVERCLAEKLYSTQFFQQRSQVIQKISKMYLQHGAVERKSFLMSTFHCILHWFINLACLVLSCKLVTAFDGSTYRWWVWKGVSQTRQSITGLVTCQSIWWSHMISFGRISSKSMMSLMLLLLSELSYECCVLLSHLKQKSFCKLFGMLCIRFKDLPLLLEWRSTERG